MTAHQLRTLTAGLGIDSIAFGATAIVAPRLFGRLLGIEAVERPQVASILRSVGGRDITVGYGLTSAATTDLPVAPWLLARLICDGVDAIACALAIRNGARDSRFVGLTGFAVGATAGGGAADHRGVFDGRRVDEFGDTVAGGTMEIQ